MLLPPAPLPTLLASNLIFLAGWRLIPCAFCRPRGRGWPHVHLENTVHTRPPSASSRGSQNHLGFNNLLEGLLEHTGSCVHSHDCGLLQGKATDGTQPRGDVRRPRKRAEHVLSLSHTPGIHMTTHMEKLTPALVPIALGAQACAAHMANHQRLAPPKAGIIPLVSRRSGGRHDTAWPRAPITSDTVRLSGGQGPMPTETLPSNMTSGKINLVVTGKSQTSLQVKIILHCTTCYIRFSSKVRRRKDETSQPLNSLHPGTSGE